jgi:hypothetical protein
MLRAAALLVVDWRRLLMRLLVLLLTRLLVLRRPQMLRAAALLVVDWRRLLMRLLVLLLLTRLLVLRPQMLPAALGVVAGVAASGADITDGANSAADDRAATNSGGALMRLPRRDPPFSVVSPSAGVGGSGRLAPR